MFSNRNVIETILDRFFFSKFFNLFIYSFIHFFIYIFIHSFVFFFIMKK